jgi:hypothetical protein
MPKPEVASSFDRTREDSRLALSAAFARCAMTLLQGEIATKRARITDGNGDSGEFAFSRPGFRIMNDAAARDVREAAHREYLDYITNAYKQPQRVRDH